MRELIQRGPGHGGLHSRISSGRAVQNFKDFRTSLARCATRLNDHGLSLNESVVFHRAIQAIDIHEGTRPILLATLETAPNPTSADALKLHTIKTYETNRGELDSPEVCTTNVTQDADWDISEYEEGVNSLWMNQGNIFAKTEKGVKITK